jgi:transposase
MFDTAGRGAKGDDLQYQNFVGIDWGTEKHRVCLMNRDGKQLQERWCEHSGDSLAELMDWLRNEGSGKAEDTAVAIEIPRGAVVETLVEHGFRVFSINPKQLDRFRDRYSPAGAKDDRRDAFVLADSLRTDMHCFHVVRIDDPVVIRLRDLSRLDDDIKSEGNRVTNQFREQLQRFFPQLLKLSSSANEPWLWALFELAPLPVKAARLSEPRITRILRRYRIRRWDAGQVRETLAQTSLTLAPGAAESASERALFLLPRLRLLREQRTEIAKRIEALLGELGAPTDASGETTEHRDAAILLSLPGVGRQIAATMLSEASEAIAERDYHAFRCYSGSAPITRQSGKKIVVIMRQGCNERLRNALYHWSRVSIACDPASKEMYAAMRARGHTHGRALRGIADRWSAVLFSMLRHKTLYNPKLRAA